MRRWQTRVKTGVISDYLVKSDKFSRNGTRYRCEWFYDSLTDPYQDGFWFIWNISHEDEHKQSLITVVIERTAAAFFSSVSRCVASLAPTSVFFQSAVLSLNPMLLNNAGILFAVAATTDRTPGLSTWQLCVRSLRVRSLCRFQFGRTNSTFGRFCGLGITECCV